MKRRVFTLLALVFGLVIMGLSIWRTQLSFVTLAVGNERVEEMVESTVSAVEAFDKEDDYSLAYPGILPDHPLYFLKMIRDRIQLWITRDSLKRAELMLHYADKRIAASLALAEKEKNGLAVSTATKAEKYMGRSLDEAKKAEASGKDVNEFYKTLVRASIKHKEIMVGVKSRIPDESLQVLKESMDISQSVYEQGIEMVGEEVEAEEVDTEGIESEEGDDADETGINGSESEDLEEEE